MAIAAVTIDAKPHCGRKPIEVKWVLVLYSDARARYDVVLLSTLLAMHLVGTA